MVRAFPEAGLVVFPVYASVVSYAPEPFALFPVDEVVLDEFPAHQGVFKSGRIVEMIPEIEAAYYGLCLYPPVPVPVYRTFWAMLFVYHSSFMAESFEGGGSDFRYKSLYPFKHFRFSKHQSGLVDEPRGLDVVSI